MSQTKKTIAFNPELFNGGSSKTKKKKPAKRSKNNLKPKPNSLKHKLLEKIKAHAAKNNHKTNNSSTNSSNIHDNVDDSFSYLDSLSQQHREKKKNKKNKSNSISGGLSPHTPSPINIDTDIGSDNSNVDLIPVSIDPMPMPMSMPVSVEPMPMPNTKSNTIAFAPINDVSSKKHRVSSNTPVFNIAPAPPYGSLKNGKKPTYRQWNQTQKNRPSSSSKIKPALVIHDPNFNPLSSKPSVREQKLKKIRNKYTLGRNKKKRSVSILIKDNMTRKKVKYECQELKQKSIKEIKDYLKKHNLIKSGSMAPNDVLRKMYEDSILAGEIKNNRADILLHNYTSED